MKPFIKEDQNTVYVLTSTLENKHYGMVATWICPASLNQNELRFTLPISKFNNSMRAILGSRKFIIHKLPKDQYMTAFRMGLYHSEDFDKFSNEKFSLHESGIRILSNASTFGLGSVISYIETEDRYILYCSLTESRDLNEEAIALTQEDLFMQLSEADRSLLSKKYLSDCQRDTPSK